MKRDLTWGLLLLGSAAYCSLKATWATTALARWIFGGLGLVLTFGGAYLIYDSLTTKPR